MFSLIFGVPTFVIFITYVILDELEKRPNQLVLPGLSLENLLMFILCTPVQACITYGTTLKSFLFCVKKKVTLVLGARNPNLQVAITHARHICTKNEWNEESAGWGRKRNLTTRVWTFGGVSAVGASGFYSISVEVNPLHSRLFTLPMLEECSLHSVM